MENQGKYIRAWIYSFNILSMALIIFPGQIKLQIYEQSQRLLNPNCRILSLNIDIKWVDIVFYI